MCAGLHVSLPLKYTAVVTRGNTGLRQAGQTGLDKHLAWVIDTFASHHFYVTFISLKNNGQWLKVSAEPFAIND